MGPLLLLKPGMSRSRSLWSRWVCLAERSHSNFAIVYLMCAGEDLPLSDDADEGG
jgi:hypothetical protein